MGGWTPLWTGKRSAQKHAGTADPYVMDSTREVGLQLMGLKCSCTLQSEIDDDGLEIYNHFDPMKSVAWDPSTAERQGGVEHGACPLAVDSYNAYFATPGSGTESDGGSKKRRRVETTVAPSGDTMKKYFIEQRDFYTACLNKCEEVANGE